MKLRNSADGYGTIPQLLHWTTVVLVVAAWTLGILGDELPKGAARASGLAVHISAGLAILVILIARLLWRLADPPPPAETTVPWAWLEHVGRVTHFALYGLLIAAPAAGILVQFSRGNALPLFGLSELPSPWMADRSFARSAKEIHEVLANGLMVLALVHAAAALAHHWLFRDRTLVRMLPRSLR